ncbi:MAG: two-component regulator propeller domain-containing protein, partial [Ferruginibacter sp.]
MPLNSLKKAVTILFLVFCYANAVAQQGIAFQHLNTSNGLSYLGVNDMCVDKKGNLWIATGNGLNMFNGKTVDRYFASEYPQLQNSNVIHVTCDSGNRVWVLTANGNVTMLDEKRQMHRVALYEKNLFIKTRWILNSQQGGIILFTDKGHYAFNSHKTEVSAVPKDSLTTNHFSLIPVKGFDTLQPKFYRQIFRYDDANYLFVQEDVFYKVNYKTRRVEKKYNIPYCTALIKWGTDELMLYDREANEVRILNLSSGTSKYPFKDLKDQSGKKVEAAFLFAEKINSNQYLFTTSYSGIYIYNSHTNKIYNYTHNISDPSSVSNDIQTTLAVGKEGWVFITCNPNGISYFNTNNFITNQSVFTDASGRGYDGYIA